MGGSPLARRNKHVYNINEKRPRAVFNCLELAAPSSTHEKKQAYMNKLTTKKQMQIQTWWALVGARSKLRSKVIFFSILCHFHASLTLCVNFEKLQKNVVHKPELQ